MRKTQPLEPAPALQRRLCLVRYGLHRWDRAAVDDGPGNSCDQGFGPFSPHHVSGKGYGLGQPRRPEIGGMAVGCDRMDEVVPEEMDAEIPRLGAETAGDAHGRDLDQNAAPDGRLKGLGVVQKPGVPFGMGDDRRQARLQERKQVRVPAGGDGQ